VTRYLKVINGAKIKVISLVDQTFDVSIQPDVSALKMFRSMSFTPWYALGEFVDNSITSAVKNIDELKKLNGPDYQLRVKIEFPAGKDQLIIDDNAAGIAQHEMARALKTGTPPDDTSIGLSKHGVGMKAASFWWGSTLTIETFPLNLDHGWKVVIDISDPDNIQTDATVVVIPHRGHSGTKVTVDNLWQKTPQGRTVGAIKSYLPSIYRAYISGSFTSEIDCEIQFEKQVLQFTPPNLLTAPYWNSKEGPAKGSQDQLWKDAVHIKLASGKSITGWVGILQELSRDLSGFFLHYRGKGIAGVAPIDSTGNSDSHDAKDAVSRSTYKPRKIFGAPGMYLDISFIGEFDITDFGKTITTDSPLWSPDEEDEFVSKLLEFMQRDEKNYIRMANSYRRREVAKREAEENAKIGSDEANKAREAFEGKIDHENPSESAKQYVGEDLELKFGEITDQVEIPIHDYEGHEHKFLCTFVNDRTRDFLVIREDAKGSIHEVIINTSHPVLDGIRMDSDARKIILRITLGLAASEVMLRSYDKHLIRDKMNDNLRILGAAYVNE
jgi:hypothetical protein